MDDVNTMAVRLGRAVRISRHMVMATITGQTSGAPVWRGIGRYCVCRNGCAVAVAIRVGTTAVSIPRGKRTIVSRVTESGIENQIDLIIGMLGILRGNMKIVTGGARIQRISRIPFMADTTLVIIGSCCKGIVKMGSMTPGPKRCTVASGMT